MIIGYNRSIIEHYFRLLMCLPLFFYTQSFVFCVIISSSIIWSIWDNTLTHFIKKCIFHLTHLLQVPEGGGALPIYCSIPMLGHQGYGFWHVLSLLRIYFIQIIVPLKGKGLSSKSEHIYTICHRVPHPLGTIGFAKTFMTNTNNFRLWHCHLPTTHSEHIIIGVPPSCWCNTC